MVLTGCLRRKQRLSLLTSLIVIVAVVIGIAEPAFAQLVTHLVNRDGVDIPCVTVGPLAPIAQEYCVRRSTKTGWTLRSDRGTSGLIIGSDGRVSAVAAGSPAAHSKLAVGDLVIAVDRQPIPEPPAQVARRLTFGQRGEHLDLALTRERQPIERTVTLVQAPEPADAPRSPNFLISIHPMMNWRGDFVPCMGAGPLAPVAVAACTSKMKHHGFVKTDALGDLGISFDLSRSDEAIVVSVVAGSPAAKADIRAGDVLTAVDHKQLVSDTQTYAISLLFGKTGEARTIKASHAGHAFETTLILVQNDEAQDIGDRTN